MFVVLPICLHAQTIEMLLSTRKNSGLGLFAAKLGETRENLIAVHSRALAFRSLALQSISIGIQASLLSVDYQNATVRGNGFGTLLQLAASPFRFVARSNTA